MASKEVINGILKKFQQVQTPEEIKKILAPTKYKIITTILLEIITIVASVVISLTAISVGPNTAWHHIVRVILLFLNLGGLIGQTIGRRLEMTGLFEAILVLGLVPFVQLMYLYLITSFFFYFRYSKEFNPDQNSKAYPAFLQSRIVYTIESQFKGRLNRLTYLIYLIITWGAAFIGAIGILYFVGFITDLFDFKLHLGAIVLAIFFLWILIAIYRTSPNTKRLHDINASGWFTILEFIPPVNLLLYMVLLFTPGDEKPNKYGSE